MAIRSQREFRFSGTPSAPPRPGPQPSPDSSRRIRAGEWRREIAAVRELVRDREAYDEAKKRLPSPVTLSGRFSAREGKLLVEHSGLLQIDIDRKGLDTSIVEVRRAVRNDPHVVAGFVSPGGQGLKLVARIDGARHAEAVIAAQTYFRATYAVKIDPSVRDLARLCFVSWDPDAWTHGGATPLPLPKPVAASPKSPSPEVVRVLQLLRDGGFDPKFSGDGWISRCPAHADHAPSLSIREGDGGRCLLKCFADCSYEAIRRAINAIGHQAINAPEIFYAADRHMFQVPAAEGNGWIEASESGARRFLKCAGVTANVAPGESASPLDHALDNALRQRAVVFAGPVAGMPVGLHQTPDGPILVTRQASVPEGRAGKWQTIRKLVGGMLGEGQLPFLCGWLQMRRLALANCSWRPGQLLVFVGPAHSGKSLLQRIIADSLGGRVANPVLFMTGRTDFNGDLAGAENLVLEDDQETGVDIVSRKRLAEAVKGMLFRRAQPIHGKHRQIVTLCPIWAATLSLNESEQSLRILPVLDGSLLDKLSLFHCTKRAMPMPAGTERRSAHSWTR